MFLISIHILGNNYLSYTYYNMKGEIENIIITDSSFRPIYNKKEEETKN